ncbi:MAG: hypothetical protein ACLPT4_04545 [Verrucomicrobiia bacterium]
MTIPMFVRTEHKQQKMETYNIHYETNANKSMDPDTRGLRYRWLGVGGAGGFRNQYHSRTFRNQYHSRTFRNQCPGRNGSCFCDAALWEKGQRGFSQKAE